MLLTLPTKIHWPKGGSSFSVNVIQLCPWRSRTEFQDIFSDEEKERR